MVLRILLIGDTSGNPDEGMKKTGHKLSELLCSNRDINVAFASVPEVLRNRASFGRIDIIHYIAGPTWRSFLHVRLLKRFLGYNAKTIISFIHPHWSVLASVFFRVFRPDAVIVQSVEWKHKCSRSGVLISDDLLVGVDLDSFKPVPADERMRIRIRLSLPLDRKILLHVGHLNRGRNLLSMTGFQYNGNILPVVIGSTTVRPDSKVVKALKKAGVKVVYGYQENIEYFYQTADCYVFPTVDPRSCAQVPLSVLEALACGTPVVSTRFEGLPIFLPGGFPGLTYLDDNDSIPQTVERVLSSGVKPDPTRLSKFSWDRIAARLSVFYQKILAV